ncbi:hypothetical protein JMUB6875_55340 [Nocardia sp. JMUB6875]
MRLRIEAGTGDKDTAKSCPTAVSQSRVFPFEPGKVENRMNRASRTVDAKRARAARHSAIPSQFAPGSPAGGTGV